jgi:hypothetical protein
MILNNRKLAAGRGVDGRGSSPVRRHFGHIGHWRFDGEVIGASDLSVRSGKNELALSAKSDQSDTARKG